jgi:hypothetical protein
MIQYLRRQPFERILGVLCFFSLAGYLASAYLTTGQATPHRLGFPLDDAWIHQTYARNLVENGEWAFIPGQPSTGSTAPLWTALLAIGALLRLGPYVWTYLLGWGSLWLVAWLGGRIFAALVPERAGWAPWVMGFLALEYHLVWASGSGMETLLYAGFVLAVFSELLRPQPHWTRLGLWLGGSLWIRPDGITLLGPAMVALVVLNAGWKKRGLALQRLLISLGGLVVLYFLFNLVLSGNWLPNTYFAKQAEYAIHRQQPLIERYMYQLAQLLIGPGALLLPGMVGAIYLHSRKRNWVSLAILTWLFGFLLLYALRLPVTYQYGRYIIPAMPVYFIWSLAGAAQWLARPRKMVHRVLQSTWRYSLVLVLLGFWLLGAQVYGRDVAIIESEMVATAQWINRNTPATSVIAAHDIGALGYFTQRQILDMAGLISPQVIPFIRDEARLASFLDEHGADYLMTFPGWYPELVQRGSQVFSTQAPFSPLVDGENMAVYLWRR